jgi:hypothetical protein
MSDHERLAALRRPTVKRGATKADAETARRLAADLEKKLGPKGSRERQARGRPKAALPEPPDARFRRIFTVRAEWATGMAGVGMTALGVLYFGSTWVMLGLLGFDKATGSDLDGLAADWFLKIKLALMGFMVIWGLLILAPLIFLAWFLRTPAGARLKGAIAWIAEHVPFFAIMCGAMFVGDWLERSYGFNFVLATALAFIPSLGLIWVHARLHARYFAPSSG